MTANNPVNFYLFSDYPSVGSGSCKVSSNPIVAEDNFTDFTLHWTAPEDGIFYFIFTGPTAVILLIDHGSVGPVEQSATITYPTSIETMLSTYATTATLSSTVTITTPLYLQNNKPVRIIDYRSNNRFTRAPSDYDRICQANSLKCWRCLNATSHTCPSFS